MLSRLTFLFVLTILSASAHAQDVNEHHPKKLWCANDTFYLKYGSGPKKFPYRVSRTDNTSPGTDAGLNKYATLYYGKDSLRINYNNRIPYQHNFYIPFESPKGKTTFRFHFNGLTAYFPREYMEKNMGNVQFDIPEVFELANIIWALSPSGERAKDLDKESEYFQRVVAYFKPFLQHPIFKALDFPDSLSVFQYYEFRENSFAFTLKI